MYFPGFSLYAAPVVQTCFRRVRVIVVCLNYVFALQPRVQTSLMESSTQSPSQYEQLPSGRPSAGSTWHDSPTPEDSDGRRPWNARTIFIISVGEQPNETFGMPRLLKH